MYFKEFSCNQVENMQARCVPRFIQRFPREVLIKSSMQIAQTDFSCNPGAASAGGKYASKVRTAIYSAIPQNTHAGRSDSLAFQPKPLLSRCLNADRFG